MPEPNDALTLQLLEWIENRPRTYAEVLDAWKTTCPRLSIWEDACIDGLVDCEPVTHIVSLSAKGKALLREHELAPAHSRAHPTTQAAP